MGTQFGLNLFPVGNSNSGNFRRIPWECLFFSVCLARGRVSPEYEIPVKMKQNTVADSSKLDLFEYDNFIIYLNDYFNYQKTRNPKFSWRYFAKRSNFNSHTVLFKILRGQSQLSLENALKIGKSLGFGKQEQEYFNTLILYNQSNDHVEKNGFLQHLKNLRPKDNIPAVQADQYAYFDKWYLQVLRELAVYAPWYGSFQRMGEFFDPPLSESQVKEGINTLIKLGLLKKRAGGKYAQTDEIISSKGLPSHVLKSTRTELILKAISAGDSLPVEMRHLSYCTFTVSRKKYLEMCWEIDELRQKFLAEANESKEGEAVYAFSVQLYPLSKHWIESTREN